MESRDEMTRGLSKGMGKLRPRAHMQPVKLFNAELEEMILILSS